MPETDRKSPIEALASPPLILLAEDDAISRRFLVDALGQLGCDVEACADGARALVLGAAHRFDLLILDRCMPRAGAEEIVRRLRGDAHARSRTTSAIATSAEITPSLRQDLLDQGFASVLPKPVDLNTLQATLEALLPQREIDAVLHDEAALTRSGNTETMRALRALFVVELQRLLAELPGLADDAEAFADRLHQLRAACGFCGAEALAQHAIRLRMRIDRGEAIGADGVRRFEVTVRATLDALAQRD